MFYCGLAPVRPTDVKVEGITTTTFVVKWTKGIVSPGITNYTVDVISTVTTRTQLDKKIILMGRKTYYVIFIELNPLYIMNYSFWFDTLSLR